MVDYLRLRGELPVPDDEFYVIKLSSGNYFNTHNPKGCHLPRTSVLFAGPLERAIKQCSEFAQQYELPEDCILVRIRYTVEEVGGLIR